MRANARFARNLRLIRLRRGISQEALALNSGVDRAYVSRIEGGKENPSIGVADDLAEALGIDITEFFAQPRPGEEMPKPLKSGRRQGTRRRRN